MIEKLEAGQITQPKKESGDLMAKKGIRVPERKYCGKNTLWRSEHPQDYAGSSDLFPNVPNDRRWDKVENLWLKLTEIQSGKVQRKLGDIAIHCNLLNLKFSDFISELTYSPWEKLKGINRTICADPAIKGRYHVFGVKPEEGYAVVGDKTLWDENETLKTVGSNDIAGFINLYEQVRELFGVDQCPIVEIQSVRNKDGSFDHFALQIHEGRLFREAGFKIDDVIEKKYVEGHSFKLPNVIGATRPEGERAVLTLGYPTGFIHSPEIIEEEASSVCSSHRVARPFSEIMFRRRKLHLFSFFNEYESDQELVSHCSRNAFMKPSVSIPVKNEDLDRDFLNPMFEGKLTQVNARFVSDGNTLLLSYDV